MQSLQPPSLQAGGRRCHLTLAAAFGHIEIESDNDSISFFVRGDSLFPSCRKSSRTATRFTMFARFLEIQKRSHFRTIALLFKFSFSKIIFSAIFPQSHPTTGRKPSPRRRSDRKIGNKAISPAPRKKLSRFPTQFRRDQTRQQSSAGTARPYKHRAQAVTTTAQRPESWEQSNLPASRKKLSRFPTQFRRDQTR